MKTDPNKILDPLTALYMQDSDEYDLPEEFLVNNLSDEIVTRLRKNLHVRRIKNSANEWTV